MISFYPGPSRVFSRIPEYIYDAYREGILGINHRSRAFMNLYAEVHELMQEKLAVPEDYRLLFFSSATECWEVIAQSLLESSSLHFYNGSFGEKWFQATQKLGFMAKGQAFQLHEIPQVPSPEEKSDLWAFTQNETSNGTCLPTNFFDALKIRQDQALLAVDATSSMSGVNLPLKQADIWYASVQKCFGLPAGLALMLVSPKAMDRAQALNRHNHYNSLAKALEHSESWQTTHTPNVLNIYLLKRVLEQLKPIAEVEEKIRGRYEEWEDFLIRFTPLTFLCEEKPYRSPTVLCLKCPDEASTQHLLREAMDANIILGKGYGPWKKNTLRIANFPAIKREEIRSLHSFLKKVNYSSFQTS